MTSKNPSQASDLLTLLQDRHSTRSFLDRQVPDSTIIKIVDAASRSPSWCNAQPWQVIVTRGGQTTMFSEALLSAAQNEEMEPDFEWPKSYNGYYKTRRQECGYQLYESVGIARTDYEARTEQMLQNYKFFGAPHVAIITTDMDLGVYGAIDCGGFMSVFTLVANALGVATVVQASVAGFAPTVRRFLEIPDDRKVVCAISLGYENPSSPINLFRTSRAPTNEVLTLR